MRKYVPRDYVSLPDGDYVRGMPPTEELVADLQAVCGDERLNRDEIMARYDALGKIHGTWCWADICEAVAAAGIIVLD